MSSKAADAIEARGLEKATMKYTVSVVNNMVKKFNISLSEACELIIPGLFEPPVRTLRATIPENESHIFR